VRALAAGQWAAPAQPLIGKLIRLFKEQLDDLQPLATPQPATLPSWGYAWRLPINAIDNTDWAIRNSVGAPQWTPN
jgi:hypothetical protein